MPDTLPAETNFNVPQDIQGEDQLLKWLKSQETPLDMIETREGRGGKEFYYLRHQYVTETLNTVTRHNWDFEVLRERMDEDCITVLGKLSLRVGSHTVIKNQYGSSDVKRRKDDTPLSIGDDFKSAASDSLKKCASLLGLGLDLSIPIRPKTRRGLHAVGMDKCRGNKDQWDKKRHKAVRTITGGDTQSSNDLLDVQARILTSFIRDDPEEYAPVVQEMAAKLR